MAESRSLQTEILFFPETFRTEISFLPETFQTEISFLPEEFLFRRAFLPAWLSPGKVHPKSNQSFSRICFFLFDSEISLELYPTFRESLPGKKIFTFDFRDQNGIFFGDGEKFVIRLSVINFIASFQNVSDGLPIQPCGFFCRGKNMEKHLWLVLNFDRESHFVWGKKVFCFWKKQNFWN